MMQAVMERRPAETSSTLVTMHLDRQVLGIPMDKIHSVLKSCPVTRVPLAPEGVKGLINLHGRIVTVVDLRSCLGLLPVESKVPQDIVVVEHGGECYGLLMDSIDDLLTVPPSGIEHIPPHLPSVWNEVAAGVYRLQDTLLVLVDVDALFAVLYRAL